jgi:hypothetical protein
MVKIDIWRGTPEKSPVDLVKEADPSIGRGTRIVDGPRVGASIYFSSFAPARSNYRFSVHIWPEAYSELAKAMLEGAPKEAEEAFLSALLEKNRNAKGS